MNERIEGKEEKRGRKEGRKKSEERVTGIDRQGSKQGLRFSFYFILHVILERFSFSFLSDHHDLIHDFMGDKMKQE